jgi:hypothetical protein
MSDWEEFCDSTGMSIGDEDAYDNFIDRLDKDIKHGDLDNNHPYHQEDIPIDELIAILVDLSLNKKIAMIHCEFWNGDNGTEYVSEKLLAGLCPASDPKWFKVMIYCNGPTDSMRYTSAGSFIEALRISRIPVDTSSCVLAWDEHSKSLDCWIVAEGPFCRNKSSSMDGAENPSGKMKELLIRLAYSDHCLKPHLILYNELEAFINGKPFTFIDAAHLKNNALSKCMLGYFNLHGKPCYIPLTQILKFTNILHTKCGSYLNNNGVLSSLNGVARLLGSAYRLYEKQPDKLTYYILKKTGTVYEAAFLRIPQENISCYSSLDIYVTEGPHPLDCWDNMHSPYVSTLYYLEQAIKAFKDSLSNPVDLDDSFF